MKVGDMIRYKGGSRFIGIIVGITLDGIDILFPDGGIGNFAPSAFEVINEKR